MIDDLNAGEGVPPRLLIDLAEGRLDDAEVETVELWLRAEGMVAPPPWIRGRAERIARQWPRARRAGRPDPLRAGRRVVAALRFDSSSQVGYAGLRGGGTQVRRLLFQADNLEVDLEVKPVAAGERVCLAGQVTARGSDPSGGYLRLTPKGNGNGSKWEAPLDGAGEFRLENLEPGAYTLEVVLGDRVVEVPVLPI